MGWRRNEVIDDDNMYWTPGYSLCGWASMHVPWPKSRGPTQKATQWLVEWLEEVAEEPWTDIDKDFQHRWKSMSHVARPKRAFKEVLLEPVGKKVEERQAAMAAYAAGFRRVRDLTWSVCGRAG